MWEGRTWDDEGWGWAGEDDEEEEDDDEIEEVNDSSSPQISFHFKANVIGFLGLVKVSACRAWNVETQESTQLKFPSDSFTSLMWKE